MKNFYLIFAGFILLSFQLKAQAPNFLNYQGVARDASGIVLPNQNIGLRFTIHQGTAGGTVVYQETQSTTTNLLGLFSVAIGTGTVVSGNIANIAWNANSEYLQVEMDPTGGSAYANMGTTQFLSVPYAFTAGSSTSSWNLTGNSSTNSSSYIGTTDANDLVLKTHANENVRISNSTGNVGINTPSAKNILDVNGSEAIGTYAGNATAPSNGLIVSGQVGIGTNAPNAGAALDITSSSQGLLIPRLAANPASPSQGMMYYNTTTGCFMYYTGTMWDAMVCPCPNNPAAPGAISGITTFCSGQTGVVYSIASPVGNATSYLWTVPSGSAITGGQGSTAITATMGSSSGAVTVAGVNNCGTGSTSSLGVTVGINAGITTSPTNQNVVSGNTATFTVAATGLPITYQWQLNSGSGFGAIPGATNSTYTTPATSTGMSGNIYNVIVSGQCGSPVTSGSATLTVCPGTPATPGAISGPTTFCPGTTGVVYSVASVTFATTYTWAVPAGTTITNGAGTNSITVTSGSTSGNITVTAGNVCVTSSQNTLALTAGVATAITAQPSTQSVSSGSTATFTVTATGSSLTYQWQSNTGSGYSPIPGATLSSYTTPATTTGMNDNLFQVVITGTCGTITSNPATLSVCSGSPTSVQISIQNNQSIPTVTNFAQRLILNSNTYSSLETTGLTNVIFSTGPNGTGTLLQAWIETGNTNTSTTTVYWVNLGSNIIAANSSMYIYMSFTGTGLSASGPTGEAPQLSGTTTPSYGSLDNGALVFPQFYDNFAGSTLSSNWTIVAGKATAPVNNGLTLTSSGVNWFGIYETLFPANGSYNTNLSATDAYCKFTGGLCINTTGPTIADPPGIFSSNGINNKGANTTPPSDGVDAQLATSASGNLIFGNQGSCQTAPAGNGAASTVTTTPAAGTFYVFSFNMSAPPVDFVYSTTYTQMATNNAGLVSLGSPLTPVGVSPTSEVGLGTTNGNAATFGWFRIRPLPPNSVFPTVTAVLGCF